MALKTFKRGISLPEYKALTRGQPLLYAPVPAKVLLPLKQGPGDPAKPIVKPNDEVQAGELLAEAQGPWGIPVLAPIGGVVDGIIETRLSNGLTGQAIIIIGNGNNEVKKMKPLGTDINNLSPESIIKRIRDAGIIGMGGAGFPTHIKLAPPPGINIDTVIINGVECEPYLTGDEKLMESQAKDIVQGLLILMRATNAKNGIVGLKSHKIKAYESLKAAIGNQANIKIIGLADKYPQGGEKQLIDALIGQKIPQKCLPCHVGVVVNNVQTAVAVKEAVLDGLPLLQRIITLTGSGIKEPKDIKAYIGTPLTDLLELAGGLTDNSQKVICGGPMMGTAQHYFDFPIGKCDAGILVLNQEESFYEKESPCIRCARCIDHCPIYLNPIKLANRQEKNMLDQMEKENIFDCIECGTCSYICPAKRSLVQRIILGKQAIRAAQRKQQGRN